MKRIPIRIIQITVHRSKRNHKLGHAVAILYPCSHHKYLGITFYKGEEGTYKYLTNECKIVKFEDYSTMDRQVCKRCPHDDNWLDDLPNWTSLDDVVQELETLDEID